jgi:hypothetical protein
MRPQGVYALVCLPNQSSDYFKVRISSLCERLKRCICHGGICARVRPVPDILVGSGGTTTGKLADALFVSPDQPPRRRELWAAVDDLSSLPFLGPECLSGLALCGDGCCVEH